VVRVDLESRKIDLRLADSEISTLPPQGKKASRKGGGLVGSLGDFDSFDDEDENPAVARKRKAARSAPSISTRDEAPTRAPGRAPAKRGAASSAYAPAPAARKAAKPKPKAKPKTTAKRVTKAAKPKKKR